MVVCCHSLDVRVRALSGKYAQERWRTQWLHGVAIRVVMCRYARRRKKRQARKMTGELDHNCRGTGLVAALGVQVYHCWKGEDASGKTGNPRMRRQSSPVALTASTFHAHREPRYLCEHGYVMVLAHASWKFSIPPPCHTHPHTHAHAV